MLSRAQTNFVLTISNIIALSHYSTPAQSWTLPIFMLCVHLPIVKNIKLQMQLISVLALFSSFLTISWLVDILSICALAFALNAGSRLDFASSMWVIYFCLGLGVILGYWM